MKTRFKTEILCVIAGRWRCGVWPIGVFLATSVGLAAPYSHLEATTPEGISLVVLRDDTSGLEAAIAPTRGGELAGLRVLFRGEWVELIYRAREYGETAGWRGKAPILWPAVGRNFSSTQKPDPNAESCSYDYNGRRYDLPIHGFARFNAWRVLDVRADDAGAAATLELTDSAESRRQYPFGFKFTLTYRVANGRLQMEHNVTAAVSNTAPMPFSIGNHLTFRMPLLPDTNIAAMTLQSPSRIEYLKNPDTIPTGETRPRSFPNPVRLSDLQFMPPIALGGYEGDPWLKLSDPAGLSIRVAHHSTRLPTTPLIQFNLWGAPSQGFFCPEPWVGMLDSLNRGEGLVELASGRTWTWTVEIEVER